MFRIRTLSTSFRFDEHGIEISASKSKTLTVLEISLSNFRVIRINLEIDSQCLKKLDSK